MGICFFCPNGHPLNVKAELAGKVGLCPKCRVKMRIPLQSMRKIDEKDYNGQPTAEVVLDAPERGKDSSNSLKDSRSPDKSHDLGASSNFRSDSPTSELIQRATEKTSRNVRESRHGEDLRDSASLLNDPDSLWYVITPNDQRYGPAQGSDLRVWINERRVGPKTLILRSGWQSPREAGQVFPEIVELFEKDVKLGDDLPSGTEEKFDGSTFGGYSEYSDTRRSLDELRKNQRRAVGALCLIGVLTVILLCAVGALIWILLRQ